MRWIDRLADGQAPQFWAQTASGPVGVVIDEHGRETL